MKTIIAIGLIAVNVVVWSKVASQTATKPNQSVARTGSSNQSLVEIPRSMPGDKGRYYLLSQKREGAIVTSLHKRVGVSSTGWTLVENNCETSEYRELAYGETGPNSMNYYQDEKWVELVPGSSKSDLHNFVCRRG